MKFGPDLLLGLAGKGVRVHACQSRLAYADGPAHHLDLVRILDRARLLGHLLALDIDVAGPLQCLQPQRLDLVDGDPFVAAAVLAQQADDLSAPGLDLAIDVLGRSHVDPRDGTPDLVDAGQGAAEMIAALEFKQDRWPIGKDEGVAIGVVQRPQLHVRGIERVADIDRIVEQGGHNRAAEVGGAASRGDSVARNRWLRAQWDS